MWLPVVYPNQHQALPRRPFSRKRAPFSYWAFFRVRALNWMPGLLTSADPHKSYTKISYFVYIYRFKGGNPTISSASQRYMNPSKLRCTRCLRDKKK